jgi:RNase H-like domain found in reverse transcriptase
VTNRICIASKLSDTERRYAAIDTEDLTSVFALKQFQQYILGRRFTLKTDHKPLERLFSKKLAANRNSLWALTLSMFDFNFQCQAGINYAQADVLSRLPVPVDWTETSISERMGETSQLLHHKLQYMASISKIEITQKTAGDSILSQFFVYIERGCMTNIKCADTEASPHVF